MLIGDDFLNLGKTQKALREKYGDSLSVRIEDKSVVVSGELDSWGDIVDACSMCVTKEKDYHVVNDIKLKGVDPIAMRVPDFTDSSLEGESPDVLIIGGGISGASIARELMKWNLDVLLVDKEADVALHASGRNDGEVHPGVDLGKGTLKQKYVVKANRMYDEICSQLDVPFKRVGQFVGFFDKKLRLPIKLFAMQRKHVCGVDDTAILSKDEIRRLDPGLTEDFEFALYNPSAGSVSPYELTIAYAENACMNGAKVSLETAVLSMDVADGKIKSVNTNRGKIYPKIVINAAGVFAEDIAKMAEDRFFSIHPRRGTNSILDKNAGKLVKSIASWKTLSKQHAHTKGGGIVHTASDNLLVGPDAVETYEKEDFSTVQESIDNVFEKQEKTSQKLKKSDIITYFTGIRAATFEEDFILERGRKTENLIHCAGIQSPGLTTAPAVAIDIAKMSVELLNELGCAVSENKNFNPIRKGIPKVAKLPYEKREALIKENPDYGQIVCRCEEISRGEIIDALHSPLGVHTVDGVKKRVRPGMGRCQGGFCMPLVSKIISEELGIPSEEVYKGNSRSNITFGKTKQGAK